LSRPYVRNKPGDKKPVYDFISQPNGGMKSGLTIAEIIKRKERANRIED
jgi:hypothetical protein